MEDITDADHKYSKRVWKNCKKSLGHLWKNLGEYNDLYAQNKTLMRLCVFESFCNNCIEIYDLHLALFFSATGLVWKVCLNNNGKHEYRKNLYDFHNELPFLPERMEIKKYEKFVCNIYDKSNYAAQIRTLKQALNHGLILKKVHRVIKFN